MRIFLTLPVLAFAALLGFSASGVQAGRFFGSTNSTDSTNPYTSRSQNSFDFGPGSYGEARQPVRHRWFHRNQRVANDGMPTNAAPGYGMAANPMPGYGMPQGYGMAPAYSMPQGYGMTPAYSMTPGYGAPLSTGVPMQNLQAPIVQSPILTAPVRTTSVAPAPVSVTPTVQSRLVPIPAPMPSGPTTAEPPLAVPTGKGPF